MEAKGPEKKRKAGQSLLTGGIAFVFVLVIAGLSIWVMGFDYIDTHSMGEFFLRYVLIVCIIMFMVYFHAIVHEAGHCVMGLLSGYRFLSYRVGSFTWIKYEDKIQLKKYSIPGTAGQCLMIPPEYNGGKFPYKRYFFGGILGNLALNIVCIAMCAVFGTDTFVGKLMVVCIAVGAYDILLNGIPMVVGGVPNDGKNVLLMTKREEERKNIWEVFTMLAEHYKGTSIIKLPKTWEWYTEEEMIAHVHETGCASQAGLKLAYMLAQKEFEKADVFLDKLLKNEMLPDVLRNEFLCEKIYLEVLLHGRKDVLEQIYDSKLKSYVNNTKKTMLSKRRMLFAYELLYRGDEKKAQKEKEQFGKMCKKYPNQGEIEEEKMLLEVAEERKEEKIRSGSL